MTDTEVTPATPAESDSQEKPDWWVRHYTFFGTAVGLVFIWFSLTPSLLPRGPLFQGLVSGGAGAIGYGLGVFGVWLVRYMRSADTSPKAPKWAWLALVVVGIIGQILMIIYFHVWQDEVRDFMGVPRLAFWDHPLTAVLSIVVLFVFVEIGQLVGRLVRFLVRQLNRFAPPRVSAVVVVVLLLSLTIALLNGVVARVAMDKINSTFGGQRRDQPGLHGPDVQVPFGWTGIPRQLGVAGPSGPRVRVQRADGATAFGVQRQTGDRADPGVRRPAFG